MAVWTNPETFKLIELWGDETVQEELEGCKKNSQIYEKISVQMRTLGYERTLGQCREKIKELKSEYRKVRDSNNQTGNKQKKFKFYDKLNEILNDKHSISPPVILDTSAVELNDDDDVVEVPETDQEEEVAEERPNGNEPACKDEDSTTAGNSVAKEKDSDEDIKPRITGTRRKRSVKIDKMEKVIDKMCDKISCQQSESDRIFAELEEKRMKLEHEMMKMQQERQREDKEFQLRLFRMLCGQQRPNPPMFTGQQFYYPSASSIDGDYRSDSNYRSDGEYRGIDYHHTL